jgi:hypothetical protein
VTGEEGGERRSSAQPGRRRWHGEQDVFVQERDERVDVLGLPRFEVAPEQRVVDVRHQARSRAVGARARAHGAARGVQRALGCRGGHAERARGLLRGQADDVTEQERRALHRGQALQGVGVDGDEARRTLVAGEQIDGPERRAHVELVRDGAHLLALGRQRGIVDLDGGARRV